MRKQSQTLAEMIRESARKQARKLKTDDERIAAACAQGGYVTYSNGMETSGLRNVQVAVMYAMELVRAEKSKRRKGGS